MLLLVLLPSLCVSTLCAPVQKFIRRKNIKMEKEQRRTVDFSLRKIQQSILYVDQQQRQ